MKLKVKICGMKKPANIREVAALGPDYLGFIFHPRSPRHCREAGKGILGSLGRQIVPVMVSVDMAEDDLLSVVGEWGFGVVQLHGNESPGLCGRLRDRGLEVWKAIPVGNIPGNQGEQTFVKTAEYDGVVDMFLFDTATKDHGGSGKKFDWRLLENYRRQTPFMLSGGISPDDASEIRHLSHPALAGIDLNSRFETAPGIKDVALLSQFLSSLNND